MHRALNALPHVQRKKKELARWLFENIGLHFETLVADDDARSDMVKACQKIIAAADSLSRDMRLSTADFEFEFGYEENDTASRVLLFEDIDDYNIFDVATGQRLRSGGCFEVDKAGRCGFKLATLWPGLTKKVNGGRVSLRKPTVIVKFDGEIRRDAKKKPKVPKPVRLGEGKLVDIEDDDGGAKAFV
jgi:hypothetical protein